MAVVLLVRHGQASFDGPDYDVLSGIGERQSAVVGRRLAGLGVSRLVHGGLRRQTQTADVCLRELGDGVTRVRDDRWDEYDSGPIVERAFPPGSDAPDPATEQDPRRAFQQRFEVAIERWTDGHHDDEYDETYPAFQARVRDALADLAADLDRSETAVVATSGGVIAAVCAQHMGLSAAGWAHLNRVVVNSSLTKLVLGRSGTTLLTINDHAHLEDQPRELLTYR